MIKKIALVGNPNCGKTTFFNKVTGAKEYAGNRVGVTVKECFRKIRGTEIVLCDLPGIYSLSGYTADEKTAVSFLTRNNPYGVINICDGTNLRRSLCLTIQLLKLNLPVAMAINMKDECDKKRIDIDIRGLSEELGIDIYFISSKTGEGIQSLIRGAERIKRADITAFDRLVKKLEAHRNKFELKDNEISKANSIYAYADELFGKYVSQKGRTPDFSYFPDKLLVNRFLAFPCMAVVLGFMFCLTFGPFGQLLNRIFNFFFNMISQPFVYILWNSGDIIRSLFTDGILRGVESVVSYIPQLLCLFVINAVIEDSGYMARICWISDRFMRKFGLSGKSVIPFFLGLGCTTPALMSARIIRNSRERNKTLLLTPLMPCSAKIPVYVMLTSIFFKERGAFVILGVYLLGILSLFLIGYLFRNKNKEDDLFLLELPPYRLPSLKAIVKMTAAKMNDFLRRAGSVILAMSVIIWFLNNFDFRLVKTIPELSMLSVLGEIIAPVFSPLGFGSAEASAALISGLAAKESIVSTLCVSAGGIEKIPELFTPASAISFMCFVGLYFPCLSSFATLLRETDSKKWIVFSILLHTIYAYGATYVVYRILL